jgi:diacylglycerol kinase family enzyme
MSYIGPHLQVSPQVSCIDGLLDVFLFSDMSKLDLLISYASRSADSTLEDPNITHYRARQVTFSSKPPMPIRADSSSIGQGKATFLVHPHALSVMVGHMAAGTDVTSLSKKREVAPRA